MPPVPLPALAVPSSVSEFVAVTVAVNVPLADGLPATPPIVTSAPVLSPCETAVVTTIGLDAEAVTIAIVGPLIAAATVTGVAVTQVARMSNSFGALACWRWLRAKARSSASNAGYELSGVAVSGSVLKSSQPKLPAFATANAHSASVGRSAVYTAAAFATRVKAAISAGKAVGSTPRVWPSRAEITSPASGSTPVAVSTGVTTLALAPVAAVSAATTIVWIVAGSYGSVEMVPVPWTHAPSPTEPSSMKVVGVTTVIAHVPLAAVFPWTPAMTMAPLCRPLGCRVVIVTGVPAPHVLVTAIVQTVWQLRQRVADGLEHGRRLRGRERQARHARRLGTEQVVEVADAEARLAQDGEPAAELERVGPPDPGAAPACVVAVSSIQRIRSVIEERQRGAEPLVLQEHVQGVEG